MTDLGAELRRLLAERGMSLNEVARRAPCDPGYLSRVVRGIKRPSPALAARLDEVLDARGSLAALAPPVSSDTRQGGREEEEMERRRLLQDLAILGIAAPSAHALDSIRNSLSRAFGQHDHLDDWHEAVTEYGYTYISVSPAQLIPDLAADLVAVRSIASGFTGGDPAYRGWCRVAGGLSVLMAKSLGNVGDTRNARHWWNTAQRVTDESGDLDLSLRVRGERITHGLYEHRPLEMILRQIDAALAFSRGHACAGLAEISSGQAQALVMAGNCGQAVEILRATEQILAQLPPSVTVDTGSVMSWGEDRLRYTETWVFAHLGDEAQADRAAHRALQLYPASDTRTPAQISLMQAFARIRSGDVSEGIQRAQSVYEPLRPGQRTAMVSALAARVLDQVPAGEQGRPDVAAYRALIMPPLRKSIEA